MALVDVKVTRKHWKDGRPGEAQQCAVYLAVCDALNKEPSTRYAMGIGVTDDDYKIRFNQYWTFLPQPVSIAVRKWDRGVNYNFIPNLEFQLDIPDDFIKEMVPR